MAPHQLFPYDEWGGLRTSRQILSTDASFPPRDLCARQTEPGGALGSGAPEPAFSTNHSKNNRGRDPAEETEPLYFSDLSDTLDDDDDEEVLALDTNWTKHEFTPKRGVEVFVGGLTRSTRRDMLREWFQRAGEVTEVRIARDKRRRRCRGYGYVRFATSEQANRAIETMHRYEFKHGRFLGVLPSDENRTLFIGGLREEWSCDYIARLLAEKMPGLRKVEPIPDRENRQKIRTFCFLEFNSHEEAAVIFARYQVDPPSAASRVQLHRDASHPDALSTQQVLEPASTSTVYSASGAVKGFERETRLSSAGTASISSSGGAVHGMEGNDGSSESCSTPTVDSASAMCFDACAVDDEHLTADAQERWQRAMEDPGGGGGGGAGGADNAVHDSKGTALGAEVESKTLTLWARRDHSSSSTGRVVGGVPLAIDGSVLKVDWADPLRYHIHLNGGIKGPSGPEPGMVENRSLSRRNGCSGRGPSGGRASGSGGVYASSGPWQNCQHLAELRWKAEHERAMSAAPEHQHLLAIGRHHRQQSDSLSSGHHRSRSRQYYGSYRSSAMASPLITRDRGYTIADSRSASASHATPLHSKPFSARFGGAEQKDVGDRMGAVSYGDGPFRGNVLSRSVPREREYGSSADPRHRHLPRGARVQEHCRHGDGGMLIPEDMQESRHAGWHARPSGDTRVVVPRWPHGVGRPGSRLTRAGNEQVADGNMNNKSNDRFAGVAAVGATLGSREHQLCGLPKDATFHDRGQPLLPNRGTPMTWKSPVGTRPSRPRHAAADDAAAAAAELVPCVGRQGLDRDFTLAHHPCVQQQQQTRWDQGWDDRQDGFRAGKIAAAGNVQERGANMAWNSFRNDSRIEPTKECPPGNLRSGREKFGGMPMGDLQRSLPAFDVTEMSLRARGLAGEPGPAGRKPPPGFRAEQAVLSVPPPSSLLGDESWSHGQLNENAWQLELGASRTPAQNANADLRSVVTATGGPEAMWTPFLGDQGRVNGEDFASGVGVPNGVWDAAAPGVTHNGERSSWPSALLSPDQSDGVWES